MNRHDERLGVKGLSRGVIPLHKRASFQTPSTNSLYKAAPPADRIVMGGQVSHFLKKARPKVLNTPSHIGQVHTRYSRSGLSAHIILYLLHKIM